MYRPLVVRGSLADAGTTSACVATTSGALTLATTLAVSLLCTGTASLQDVLQCVLLRLHQPRARL